MYSKEFVDLLTSNDLFPLFESIRKSLSYYFATHVIQYPTIRNTLLSHSCGVFITYRDKKGNVRGCMGLLDTDRPLMYAAVDCAIAAAVEDPRYERIIIDDVVDISIEMTLIKDIQNITEHMDEARMQFIRGVHGFYIESGVKAAVLLPRDIATQGLDFDGAVNKVRTKAGITSTSVDVKYYMFPSRIFVQAGLNSEVVDLSVNTISKMEKRQIDSKKGLLSFFRGDKK